MREALRPILFDDRQVAQTRKQRITAVAPTKRSPSATQKAETKVTDMGIALQSFRNLMKDLNTLTMNTMCAGRAGRKVRLVFFAHMRASGGLQVAWRPDHGVGSNGDRINCQDPAVKQLQPAASGTSD
jgi:hypothetical protein